MRIAVCEGWARPPHHFAHPGHRAHPGGPSRRALAVRAPPAQDPVPRAGRDSELSPDWPKRGWDGVPGARPAKVRVYPAPLPPGRRRRRPAAACLRRSCPLWAESHFAALLCARFNNFSVVAEIKEGHIIIVDECCTWFALIALSFSWKISCCFGRSLGGLSGHLIGPATCWYNLFPWHLGAPPATKEVSNVSRKFQHRVNHAPFGGPTVLLLLRQTANLASRTSVARLTDILDIARRSACCLINYCMPQNAFGNINDQ